MHLKTEKQKGDAEKRKEKTQFSENRWIDKPQEQWNFARKQPSAQADIR